MYANLAQVGLVLSLLLSLFIPFGLLWLSYLNQNFLRKKLDHIILVQFIFVSFAFIALSYAYLTSDFSLYNVSRNSHIAIPTIYKFSALWGNHEGSMLLWLFILSCINFFSLQNKFSNKERIWISVVQIIVTSSLLLYTILKSNPFIKIFPVPEQGNGFNPVLQDVALAIHPPILYLGYISTVLPFSISIAALLSKELSIKTLEILQKWTLFSWSFLTLGIALGSWWAYRELGWGGYWFWDSVENASLLPWLTCSALLHSIYINKKLDTNYRWTILLAITTFLLSILATFFVRSGMITSVHSFANDPNKGMFILQILTVYSIISLGLFAFYASYFNKNSHNNWFSRFGGINAANILWVLSTFIILLSLLYPLWMLSSTGKQFSVDRSFFENSFIPVLLPVFLLLALTLPANWQQILPIHYKHFTYSFILAAMSTILFYIFSITPPSLKSSAAFFLGILVMIRMIFWFKQRMSTPLTLKFYLIWLVHLASGLLVANLAIIETNSQELLIKIQEGDKIKFLDFEVDYQSKENKAIGNYLAGRIILKITQNDHEITQLSPEIRYYPVEKKQTSETSIYHHIFYDLYAVINEIEDSEQVGLKIYFRPMISWLWITCIIIFICGILLLFNFKKKSNAYN